MKKIINKFFHVIFAFSFYSMGISVLYIILLPVILYTDAWEFENYLCLALFSMLSFYAYFSLEEASRRSGEYNVVLNDFVVGFKRFSSGVMCAIGVLWSAIFYIIAAATFCAVIAFMFNQLAGLSVSALLAIIVIILLVKK